MNINQKGFVSVAIILEIVVMAGVMGYLILSWKTFSPMPAPSTTDTGQKPQTSDTAEYPYILKPLSQTQLSGLRSEFETSNKNICAQINEYGFTEFKSDCFSETVKIEIVDEEKIVEMVKDWLVQNSKFTGVVNKSDLASEGIDKIGTALLKIDFHDQMYNSLPVEGNSDIRSLTVFANANGVSRIDGFWFPKITISSQPKISEVSAKNKLNGKAFTYGDFVGNPIDYRVEQKDLSNTAHKVIFVKKSSQGLEFRLAWKILVGQGLSWTVYVDAITGEKLKAVQMFET